MYNKKLAQEKSNFSVVIFLCDHVSGAMVSRENTQRSR